MKLWNIPRSSGKTLYLIRKSSVTRIPILVTNFEEKEDLMRYAKEELGISIPEPVVATAWSSNDTKHIKVIDTWKENETPQKVLIDDIDNFISKIFNVIPVEATYTARLEQDIIEKRSMFDQVSESTDIDIVDMLSKIKDPNVKTLLTKLFINRPKQGE